MQSPRRPRHLRIKRHVDPALGRLGLRRAGRWRAWSSWQPLVDSVAVVLGHHRAVCGRKEAVRSQPSSDAVRQDQAQARFDELERWLRTQLSRLSAKTPLAAAICYALTRLKRLRSEHARELRRLALRAACLFCRRRSRLSRRRRTCTYSRRSARPARASMRRRLVQRAELLLEQRQIVQGVHCPQPPGHPLPDSPLPARVAVLGVGRRGPPLPIEPTSVTGS